MVQLGFYLWTAVALAMIFTLMNSSAQGKKIITGCAILIAGWLAYIIALSQSGVLANFSLPPRMPLLVVVPAIAIIIVTTGRRNFRDVLLETPRYWPVYLQSFRIVVELLIFGAFLQGVFPEKATFKGLNYDILSGISAPVVAFLYQRGKISDKGLLAWNVITLLVLALTVYSFISFFYFSGDIRTSGATEFVKLPYLLLAAVLLPVALFLHIFSLRQLISFGVKKKVSAF